MPRSRRVVQKNAVYEVVSRASHHLPLPPTETTNEILKGIYGRSLRDGNVTLCNFVEMNNHSHQHFIPTQPKALPKVYGEMKKCITESLKALLGLDYLTLWEPRATVAILPRFEDVVARLVYLFCNPAKAGLVDSIDAYPGLSSWEAFKTCPPSVDATVSIPVRYYHKAAIPRLPERNVLSAEEDTIMLEALQSSEDVFQETLEIRPLAWLQPFGITKKEEIERIRKRIIKMVYEQEEKYRLGRTYSVMGAEVLKRQEYFRPHVPRKRERKIFVICGDTDLRTKIIQFVQGISAKCRECYEQAKRGVAVSWPDGVFLPWLPPRNFCSLSP
jgi:hypothetical protein